jgi:hypothetical protein
MGAYQEILQACSHYSSAGGRGAQPLLGVRSASMEVQRVLAAKEKKVADLQAK